MNDRIYALNFTFVYNYEFYCGNKLLERGKEREREGGV